MVADYDKYNSAVTNLDSLRIWKILMPTRRRHLPLKWLLVYLMKREKLKFIEADKKDESSPGRWYYAGIERACYMLQKVVYQIVDSDVGTSLRDPIIHFIKV